MGDWFHTDHQRIVVDNDGSLASQSPPEKERWIKSQIDTYQERQVKHLPCYLVAFGVVFKSNGEIPSVIEFSE